MKLNDNNVVVSAVNETQQKTVKRIFNQHGELMRRQKQTDVKTGIWHPEVSGSFYFYFM